MTNGGGRVADTESATRPPPFPRRTFPTAPFPRRPLPAVGQAPGRQATNVLGASAPELAPERTSSAAAASRSAASSATRPPTVNGSRT